MSLISKGLILFGVIAIGVGLFLMWGQKLGISWGKLPGDFRFHTEKWGIYFPFATSLIISVMLTLILNLILWLLRK